MVSLKTVAHLTETYIEVIYMKINYPAPINIQNRYFCGYWKTDKDHSEEGESKIPIYHLTSADALNQLVGYVKFINNTNGTVLYRGQGTEHGTLPPSGCRKKYTAISDEVISSIYKDEDLMNLFKLNEPDIEGWERYRSVIIEAALQHYGGRTYCMDFVDNHWCALWFGLYSFHNSLYTKRTDADGFLYMYMYLADTNGPCIRGMYIGESTYTVDLRKALPSYFLRPAAQHGWVVRNHKRETCDYDNNVVCVAKIHISDATKWLGEGELLSQKNFFPDYDIDAGYRLLLQRQKRSGVQPRPEYPPIIPALTIANYHYAKAIYLSNTDSIYSIKVRSSIKNINTSAISNIPDLYALLLLQGWTIDTCSDDRRSSWTEDKPCLGQSAVTARLFQKCFGGDIYHFRCANWEHYFNKIGNDVFDLAFQEVDANCMDYYQSATKIVLYNGSNRNHLPLNKENNCTSQGKRFLTKTHKSFSLLLNNCNLTK